MDKLEHLTTPLLLFAVLLIVLPLMELGSAVWPVGMGNAEWRFGAVGLLSSAMLQPLIGSFIVVVVAARRERHRLQRTMCVLNGLAAVLLLVALPLFVLDSLELRSRVPESAKGAFDMAALRAFVLNGFTLIVLAALSRGGFKASKKPVERVRSPRDEGAPPLLLSKR